MAELTDLGGKTVVVPGQVVVGLKPEISGTLDVSLNSGPARGSFSSAAFGVDALDSVLADLRVSDLRRVHPPVPPGPAGVMTDDVDAAMGGVFRVRYDAATKPATVVNRLKALDAVTFVEPVYLREGFVVPNDPSFSQQWGLSKIRCPDAWDRTTGSAQVVVAVVDSGVDLDHPELASLLVAGQDMVDLGPNPGPPLPGWVWEGDFNGRDNTPQDEVGHGTHVAGTIACTSNDGQGVAGVTWACRIMPVKVLNRARRLSDNRISGFGTSVDIAAGIRWAADHGARIINLSLGGATNDQVTANAVAYALSRGVLVVAAMGNTGDAVPQFPAALPDVLAVAAVDANDVRAGFSSMGPHVDVSAPGVGILSTVWDNGWGFKDGTSMASPHVAGIAALMLSCNTNLTPVQLRTMIRDTARPLRDNPADPVPNDRYGTGLVDARAAVDRACPPRSLQLIACASNTVRCPSVAVLCPSVAIVCPSAQVVCVSRALTCRSTTLRCPSAVVSCAPSTVVRCPSETVLCGPSQGIRCPSVTVACVSTTVRCPTVGAGCGVSATVRCPSTLGCPSGPVCGFDPGIDPRINPGRFGGFDDDDPYAVDYGDGG